MGKFLFLIAFSLSAMPSYGQTTSVGNGVESMRSYVANLEERLRNLAEDYAELSTDYADLSASYQELERDNNNIINCANNLPPEIYVGGVGCKPMVIEPCKLCDADGNEVEPLDATPAE